MNGFSDIAVTFGSANPPAATRLGNRWSLAHPGPGGIWTSHGGIGSEIAVATRGRWTIWAAGDVFSYRNRTERPLERFADDILAGGEAPSELDSHAVLVGWDDAARHLHVWVNRLGTMHVYLGGQANRMRVATVFSVAAEVSSGKLDWVGITGFCGFGFYVADRTPYVDVRIIRPATHTIIDENGRQVSEDRYWKWSYEPQHERSDDDLLEEFHEIWLRTLERQTVGRSPVVPVSGGLDSRTILAGLTSGEKPARTLPLLFTYGYPGSDHETHIARAVAHSRRLPISNFVVEPYVFDRLDDVLGSVEGFSGVSLPRQAGVAGLIADMGDRIIGGHWGDVWFDTDHASPATSNTSDGLADLAFTKFAKRGRQWLFENLCRPNLGGEEPEDVLREVLRAEHLRLPDLGDVGVQLTALKTEQWSFRWTLAGTRAYHLARPTLLPFYANDVVDFFLRVPSDRLPQRRLQKHYLRRYHPDLARVRWQDSGMSLYERPWEPPLSLARRATAKALRTVRGHSVIERNWEVQYLSAEANAKLVDLLSMRGPLVEHTRPDAPAELLDSFAERPDPAKAHAVEIVLTASSTISRSSPQSDFTR